MKKLIILSICLLFGFQLKAQFSVSYSAGYGKYNMEEVKDILESVKESMTYQLNGLDIRVVDNFPGYITHTIDLGYKTGRQEWGIKSSFLTTGGKLSYADYSGLVDYQLLLRGFRESLFFRYYFYTLPTGDHSAFSFYGELSPGIIISQLEEKSLIGLYNPEDGKLNSDEKNDELTKTNFIIMPLLGARYYINQHISLHLSTGYDWHFSTNKSDYNKTDIPINWSGFRILGGASYYF
jgi:hypothetical protein